jgi:TolB-like protein
VVRVQAHRLRSKLKKYYETEGIDDPLEITLPLRAYIPTFCARHPQAENAPVAPPHYIMVVPFTNLSANRDEDSFEKGLTEELIHALAKSGAWKLVIWGGGGGPDRNPALREITSDPRVRAVLEGTVRRSRNGGIRISVNLILPDSTLVWSQMYDIEAEDVVSAQVKAASEICQALNGKLRSLLTSGH